MAYTDLRFGSGTGSIFIDNTDCVGDELRLISCRYDTHTADCTHAEDAGLRCNGRCKLNNLRVIAGFLSLIKFLSLFLDSTLVLVRILTLPEAQLTRAV